MKIAYIDLSFHKKTLSNEFVREHLRTCGHEIINFWDDTNSAKEINKYDFDAVAFFGVIPSIFTLTKLKCKNVIWLPMYETVTPMSTLNWLGYLALGVKIISFSEKVTARFKKIGFSVLGLQYFPEPVESKTEVPGLKIFFWYRIDKINWDLVKKLIGPNKVDKVIIKNQPDPDCGHLKLSEEDIENYNIKIINDWVNKERYYELLKECNLFFAPRDFEGIGMSFLEAMSCNIPVVAPDNPTMNEYITNEVDGYLYKIKDPKPLDLSNISEIRTNLKDSFNKGYQNWIRQLDTIEPFIKLEVPEIKPIKKYCLLGIFYPFIIARMILQRLYHLVK